MLEVQRKAAHDASQKATELAETLQCVIEQQQQQLRQLVKAEQKKTGSDEIRDQDILNKIAVLKQLQQDQSKYAASAKHYADLVTKYEGRLKNLNPKKKEDAPVNEHATNEPKAPAADTNPGIQVETAKADNGDGLRLIGQTCFGLRDLLHILHDDSQQAEDMQALVTELGRDVGVVLLNFQYKCESSQADAKPSALTPIAIRMTDAGVSKERDSDVLLEYPSHSSLRLQWKAEKGLQRGDRLCVVREGDPHKLTTPYFLVVWNIVDDDNDNAAPAGQTRNESQLCDWCVPDALKTCYGELRNEIVTIDADRGTGIVLFPSALRLSLPPGVYRVYLLRNETHTETQTKLRKTLGTSPPLGVLPGVNSVHTMFGTTPVIDIRPVRVSLHVLPQACCGNVEERLKTGEDKLDAQLEEHFAVELELEMAKLDFEKAASQQNATEIARLQRRVGALEAQRLQLQLHRTQLVVASKKSKAELALTSTDVVVFLCRFLNGLPQRQDRIVVLPADIVHVSDGLRATILGKLQANDPREVQANGKTIEAELAQAEKLFDTSSYLKWLRVRFRTMLNKLKWWKKKKAKEVLDECQKAFDAAPPLARSHFSLIIHDILAEINARNEILGLRVAPAARNESCAAKVKRAL